MSHVTEWLRRLRINDNFQPTFTTMNNNKTNATSSTTTSLSNFTPMHAVASAAQPHHCNKRLLSSTESVKKCMKRGQLIKQPSSDNTSVMKLFEKKVKEKNIVDYVGILITINTCVKDYFKILVIIRYQINVKNCVTVCH